MQILKCVFCDQSALVVQAGASVCIDHLKKVKIGDKHDLVMSMLKLYQSIQKLQDNNQNNIENIISKYVDNLIDPE